MILGVALGECRGFAMENPYLRPIFNFFSIIILYFIVYFYSFALVNKSKILYILGIVLFFLALVVGTRSLILQPLVFLFFMQCFIKNQKISLKLIIKSLSLACLCIYFAILISDLRNNGANSTILFSFLYGNNYSDIRDFAWILYGWNGSFLFGKTELSGILSFMPSFISDFRQHWSWGVFSTSVVGLNSEEHPGLRPGFFGESYVNFGYPGVLFIGSIIGFFIHKYDTVIHNAKKNNDYMEVVKLYTFALAVSSPNYHKNFYRMIEAYNQANVGYKLKIIGSASSVFNESSTFKDLQTDKIEFLSRVNDTELIQLYQNASFFIFPSLYEGFGIPPLETQNCGCPVISSNAASLPDVLSDSVIYFDPLNIQQIKEKIELISSNSNLQIQLREKGFENTKRFSWLKN